MTIELETKREKKRSYSSVYRELRKTGNKPFHFIKKPNINEEQREDCLVLWLFPQKLR